MLEISKIILEEYQVRKTKEQKTKFIQFLQEELNDVEIKIEEGGFCKSRNLVIGDLESSELVLAAHYDTAPVLPFPNFLAPKNFLAYLGYCLLLVIGFFIIDTVLIVAILFLAETILGMNHPEILGLCINWIFLILMIVWMLVGKENKHTANDNTSGVITLIEALHDPIIREKACFVFFDHEETGLFGSAFFAKKHKKAMKSKMLINFDCVSDGDTIMMVLSKAAMNEEEKLNQAFAPMEKKQVYVTKSSTTLYPSDQMNFKNSIGVAAFKKNKMIGYYIDRIHTKKDVIFDEKNIDFIIKGLHRYLEGNHDE